jgi:hypothetical protein
MHDCSHQQHELGPARLPRKLLTKSAIESQHRQHQRGLDRYRSGLNPIIVDICDVGGRPVEFIRRPSNANDCAFIDATAAITLGTVLVDCGYGFVTLPVRAEGPALGATAVANVGGERGATIVPKLNLLTPEPGRTLLIAVNNIL